MARPPAFRNPEYPGSGYQRSPSSRGFSTPMKLEESCVPDEAAGRAAASSTSVFTRRTSTSTSRQEGGVHRSRGTDGYRAGVARGRVAATPAVEEREEGRRGREGHHRPVIEAYRAVRAAVELVGARGAGRRSDGAVAPSRVRWRPRPERRPGSPRPTAR